ncbi:MAG: hypothetical protein Q9222_004668 [Ikaeria aurantiellina]
MFLNVTSLVTSFLALKHSIERYVVSDDSTSGLISIDSEFKADMHEAVLSPRTNVGNGVELRVYPLGDSITNGFQSSDDNGYRIGLQRHLAGSRLLFVGSKSGGTMSDGWNEGWNGFTIDQIAQKAQQYQRGLDPNIILLHAGTNDLNMSPPLDPDHAPDRLGAMIDQLIATGPDAAILVAQIINNANAQTEALVQKYNNAIPGVVSQRANAGHKVMVVDMQSVTAADLKDGLHPTDAGYQKMADIWFQAIQQASDKGWIKAPTSPDPNLGGSSSSGSSQHCLEPPFWVEALPGPIASGVGHNGDMKFHDNWIQVDSHATGIGKVGTGVVFADLNGDGRADYLFVNKTTGSVIAYLNTGTGDTITWAPVNDGKEIASGLAPRDHIRFADMGWSCLQPRKCEATLTSLDFDGKDDYCVMGVDDASVTCWLNRGEDKSAPGGWSWNGPHVVAPGAIGKKGVNVIFADLNGEFRSKGELENQLIVTGDGRPDYLVKDSNGGLDAYINVGKPKTIEGIEWIGAGHIAAGFGSDDISVVDITGDGRADYVQWGPSGELSAYLNYRTEKFGQPGWASTGALGSVAKGLGKSSAYCRLADLNGDGKADYALISDTGAVDFLYLNKGTADTSVIGDGVRSASLSGSGLDDYVWLAPNAAVTLYDNGGKSQDGQHWIWYPVNDGNEIANGAGATRDQIIFADLDGDGRDDFCIVDPKTGAINLYKNFGPQPDNTWGWIPTGVIAT